MKSSNRRKRTSGYLLTLILPMVSVVWMAGGASDAPNGVSTPGTDEATLHAQAAESTVEILECLTKHKANGAEKADTSDEPRRRTQRKQRQVEPLTGASLKSLRAKINTMQDFDSRLALRRDLIYRCHREGLAFEAQAELESLIADVAATSGPAVAHEFAYTEATGLMSRRWHAAALRAFALMEIQYREGPRADEAGYQVGICHLELQDYTAAGAMFEIVADTATSQALQGQALRKLAFTQLLKCDHEASLATLQRMESTISDPSMVEYAQMRTGFVLATANRISEAIASHTEFLDAHPNSRYGRLVLRQLKDLQNVRVATAE